MLIGGYDERGVWRLECLPDPVPPLYFWLGAFADPAVETINEIILRPPVEFSTGLGAVRYAWLEPVQPNSFYGTPGL